MYKFSIFLYSLIISLAVGISAYAETVTLSGECVGIKVYTDGLIVTDTVTLTDINGRKINAAYGCGIRSGDVITKVNGAVAKTADMLSQAAKRGVVNLTLKRGNTELTAQIEPIKTQDGKKLGLWLRDSTAGLGTLTCVYNGQFVGLGHPICDIDTGNIMPVKYGIIQGCSDISVTKSRRGVPGALTGTINGKELGSISSNTQFGISGKHLSSSDGTNIETAEKSEIRTGPASILCNIDGNGVKEYDAVIKSISISGGVGKDMVIKITDKGLISKTGGIIQGMSGSPVLQNGKLVGAVTHVFVNDPTRGYGIFIENMLDEANKIK